MRVMAETVYLNDGSMEVILTDKATFLEHLLHDRLGDDVARCFKDCVAGLREDVWVLRESVKEKERSADGYTQMCRDACEDFSEILNLLDAPRLNRTALKKAVQAGYDSLHNNL